MASGISNKLGASFHLLWTNPDPTASGGFAAQKISLDLSTYNAVLIVFLANANYNRQSTQICPKTDGSASSVLFTVIPAASENRNRNAWVTDSGVEFGDGYTGSSTASASCAPYKIYGIQSI